MGCKCWNLEGGVKAGSEATMMPGPCREEYAQNNHRPAGRTDTARAEAQARGEQPGRFMESHMPDKRMPAASTRCQPPAPLPALCPITNTSSSSLLADGSVSPLLRNNACHRAPSKCSLAGRARVEGEGGKGRRESGEGEVRGGRGGDVRALLLSGLFIVWSLRCQSCPMETSGHTPASDQAPAIRTGL